VWGGDVDQWSGLVNVVSENKKYGVALMRLAILKRCWARCVSGVSQLTTTPLVAAINACSVAHSR